MPEPLSKERIVDDFVHGTQQIQHVSEHDVMAGWNYELQLGAWLERMYRANGPAVTGHEDLTNALQSILDDEDLDNPTRFSAAYCLAMHLWNANRLSEHRKLVQQTLQDFNESEFVILRHRHAMMLFGDTQTSQSIEQRRNLAQEALEQSAKSLRSRALQKVPGVANVFGQILIFLIDNAFPVPEGDRYDTAIRALTDAIQLLEDKDSLHQFPRILITRGVLYAYAGDYPRARSDSAYGKKMRFEPKHEDELSLAKIELSSLSSTRIKEQLDESREETTEIMSRELQRSRGEVLQLLGLIGVILAFLSLGTNISLKVDEPLIVGLMFPLMGGVVVVIFGTFWVLLRSTHGQKRIRHNRLRMSPGDSPTLQERSPRSPEVIAIGGGMLIIAVCLFLLWLLAD